MPDNGADSATEATIRGLLRALLNPAELSLTMVIVSDHRSASPVVCDVPIDTKLAGQLLGVVAETAKAAVSAELRPAQAGFTPGPQQWVHRSIPDGLLVELQTAVRCQTRQQYDRGFEFGRQNLLALRVAGLDGGELGTVYQGFSPVKALVDRKRILAFWTGAQFALVDEQPLMIDRSLRLFAFADVVVMKSNGAFESLFGPLPDLREQAAATYTATLGKLQIIGGAQLLAACDSDINMMHKLLSIRRRLEQPGYSEALTMPKLLAFLARNPHIDVPVDTSGDSPELVFQSDAQHRWALLKLLDDDFLRSDLTDINYEANSKTEVPMG